MRKFISLYVFFFCARFLSAQSSPPMPTLTSDPLSATYRQMEFINHFVQQGNEEVERSAAAARAEKFARLQFLQKANKFVVLWGDFAGRLNDTQTFDAKLAKKLSKAFHELETSDGWPIREPLNAYNRDK